MTRYGKRAATQQRRPLHWAQAGGTSILPIPDGALAIHPVPGGYRAVRLEGKAVVEELAGPLPVEYCQGVREDWARAHNAQYLAAPDAAWRARPATEKQTALMAKVGLPVAPGLTRGDACDAIRVLYFVAKTLRRRRMG